MPRCIFGYQGTKMCMYQISLCPFARLLVYFADLQFDVSTLCHSPFPERILAPVMEKPSTTMEHHSSKTVALSTHAGAHTARAPLVE